MKEGQTSNHQTSRATCHGAGFQVRYSMFLYDNWGGLHGDQVRCRPLFRVFATAGYMTGGATYKRTNGPKVLETG